MSRLGFSGVSIVSVISLLPFVLPAAAEAGVLSAAEAARAEPILRGSIVGWESVIPPGDLSHGFVAVAAGGSHSLGLKADGSIVAWGCESPYDYGQCDVPAPNKGFVAVAAGGEHSLGLKGDGSIVAWGCESPTNYGQCNVPAPNADFVAIAAGSHHSLGLKADGSIVSWGKNGYVPTPNTGFIAIAGGQGENAFAIRLRPGDFNGDGRVDVSDHAAFLLHLAGPAGEPDAEDWRWFDYNDDRRVDIADHALAQNSFTGP